MGDLGKGPRLMSKSILFTVPILHDVYSVRISPDPLPNPAMIDHDQLIIWVCRSATIVDLPCLIAHAVSGACQDRLRVPLVA